MKVRIVKADKYDWYANYIGYIFHVEDRNPQNTFYDFPKGNISKYDCEVIPNIEDIMNQNNELEVYKKALELACERHLSDLIKQEPDESVVKDQVESYLKKAKQKLSKPQILPCPFCGEPAHVLSHSTAESMSTKFKVQCEDIAMHCCSDNWFDSREEAIKEWNRRK